MDGVGPSRTHARNGSDDVVTSPAQRPAVQRGHHKVTRSLTARAGEVGGELIHGVLAISNCLVVATFRPTAATTERERRRPLLPSTGPAIRVGRSRVGG